MATSQPHLSLIPGLQCKGACQADECSAWIRTCTTGLSGLLSARAGFMIQGACKQQKHFSCICCKPLSTATAVYATSKRNLGDFLQGAYQADSCMQYSACCCSYTNGSCKRCERADHTSCMPCMDWHSCLAFMPGISAMLPMPSKQQLSISAELLAFYHLLTLRAELSQA